MVPVGLGLPPEIGNSFFRKYQQKVTTMTEQRVPFDIESLSLLDDGQFSYFLSGSFGVLFEQDESKVRLINGPMPVGDYTRIAIGILLMYIIILFVIFFRSGNIAGDFLILFAAPTVYCFSYSLQLQLWKELQTYHTVVGI